MLFAAQIISVVGFVFVQIFSEDREQWHALIDDASILMTMIKVMEREFYLFPRLQFCIAFDATSQDIRFNDARIKQDQCLNTEVDQEGHCSTRESAASTFRSRSKETTNECAESDVFLYDTIIIAGCTLCVNV